MIGMRTSGAVAANKLNIRLSSQYSRNDWNADKWSRGSYAYFAPGQMVRLRQLLRQPVGRIHFAGEHTANWQGYMHGAIESGYRAAKEIDQMISCLPCHTDR